MPRSHSKLVRSATGYGASLVLILLASQASALVQNVPETAKPPDCTSDRPATQPVDAVVTLSPSRGWQMEGREIKVTITSSSLPADAKPLVCFSWKFKDGKDDKRKFKRVDTVKIVQPASQQPPSVEFAVPVPSVESLDPEDITGDDYDNRRTLRKKVIEYTPDDQFAPIAEVRILMLGRDNSRVDFMTTVAVVGARDYCNVPIGPWKKIDNGTIVQSAYKNWQPIGGEIEFTVKTPNSFPNDALIRACLRWKVNKGEHFVYSDSGPIRILDRQQQVIKLAVGLSEFGDDKPLPCRWGCKPTGSYAIAGLAVPEADLRVLVFDNNLNQVFDNEGKIGVTNLWFAGIITLLILMVAFVFLWLVCRQRFPSPRKPNPLLCLITTSSGFASLSQFQIILWTFVVIASTTYVIALSGDLILITPGTLVLLGISGAATVIAKVKSERDATASPPPLDPAAAAAQMARAQDDAREARQKADLAIGDAKEEAESAAKEAEAVAEAAKAKAEAAEANAMAAKARTALSIASPADKTKAETDARDAEAQAEAKRKAAAIAAANAAVLTRIRHPLWSDLIMEENKGRELDVTRMQMLLFTLVTAGFVAVKVITSGQIPDIPEGFLILMGISNGVYVGSKFTANPAG